MSVKEQSNYNKYTNALISSLNFIKVRSNFFDNSGIDVKELTEEINAILSLLEECAAFDETLYDNYKQIRNKMSFGLMKECLFVFNECFEKYPFTEQIKVNADGRILETKQMENKPIADYFEPFFFNHLINELEKYNENCDYFSLYKSLGKINPIIKTVDKKDISRAFHYEYKNCTDDFYHNIYSGIAFLV